MLFFVANANSWSLFGAKNFEECLLENMKGTASETAAATIYAACASKFSANVVEKCAMRPLTPSELSKVTPQGNFTNFGQPYFSADFYNGNDRITIDAVTITIGAENITPPQGYVLALSAPIGPKTSGTAGAKIQSYPTKNSWWKAQLKTCSR